MKTTKKIVKEIVKVHDFCAEVLSHPFFSESWSFEYSDDSLYLSYDSFIGVITGIEIDEVSCFCRKYGFRFVGVVVRDGVLKFFIDTK